MGAAGLQRWWEARRTCRREPDCSPCRADVARRSTTGRSDRWCAAAVLCGLAAVTSLFGCGGNSPTRADGSGLPLVPGQQLLTLTGFAASADPAFPPCAPAGLPRDGTSVNTVVVLSTENGGWVARSSANLGTI